MAEQQAEAPLVIQALQEPLLEALQETDTQAAVKNEDLHWTPFVLVVVYYFIAGIKSGRCLLTHLQHADPALGLPTNLKKSTFFEAFRRFPSKQARQLFYALLSRIAFFPVPEMAALGVLCAVDGSHWPALFSMNWAAVGVNKPTVLLHLAFGLNQMIPVGMLLTQSNSSERKALKQLLQAGVTYVADRGYFAFYLLNDIAAASAFFVIRAPGNVTYQVLDNLPVQLPSGIDWLLDVQDLKVCCGKGKDSGTWRVVRFVIGQSQFVLFSNRWELSTWQIIIIYAYRWQIELFFLFLKRTMNGLHLLTHSRNGLEIQFYLLLSAALLLLHFKQRTDAANGEGVPEAEPVQVPLPEGTSGEQEVGSRATESAAEQAEATARPEEQKEGEAERLSAGEREQQGQPPEDRTAGKVAAEPEPTSGSKEGDPRQSRPARSQQPPTQPARRATIEDDDNAQWYQDLGTKLRTFWRISIHWLQTLRDNLARKWNPAAFSKLAGYANNST